MKYLQFFTLHPTLKRKMEFLGSDGWKPIDGRISDVNIDIAARQHIASFAKIYPNRIWAGYEIRHGHKDFGGSIFTDYTVVKYVSLLGDSK
jgi:hypothetical protein